MTPVAEGGARGFPTPFGLLVGVALFGVAMGGLYPAIAIALTGAAGPGAGVGLVTTAYYAGSIVGTLTGAAVVGRLGRRRAFAGVALSTALATALLAAVPATGAGAVLGVAVLRALAGWGFGIYYLAIESWIAGLATAGNRGRALGLYETVRVGAVAAGPLLLAGLAPETGFVLAAALLAAAVLPVWRTPAADDAAVPRMPRLDRRSLADLVAASPLAFAAAFAAGIAGAGFYAYGPLFGRAVADGDRLAALFFSAVLVAPVAVHVAIGALSDRIGRRDALSVTALSAAAAAAALAVAMTIAGAAMPFGAALALALAAGAAAHPLYALGLGRLNDLIAPDSRLAAGTAILLAYNAGTVLGPSLAAASVALLGIAGLYVVIAGAGSLVALTAWRER